MPQIKPELVVSLCEARLATDRTLAIINEQVAKLRLSLTDALDLAVRFGNVMQQRNTDEETLTNGIVAAFKAGAYRMLTNSGVAFTNDKELHDRLTNLFTSVVTAIKTASTVQETASLTGGLRLGGLGGQGIIAGGSLSVEPSSKTSVDYDVGLGGGVLHSGGLAVDTGGLRVETSPLASMPAAPLIPDPEPTPVAVPQVSYNQPVYNPFEEPNLETYAEHELAAPKRRVSLPAKEANDRVTQYAEQNDWTSPLEDLVLGSTSTVYYKGADIAVRTSQVDRKYLVAVNDESKARFEKFAAGHKEAIDHLLKLPSLNFDEQKLISTVTGIIDVMRRDVVQLYLESVSENEEVTETVVAEAVRFVNAYLSVLTTHVHNGLVLATNRGTEVAGIKGRVELERKIDDLVFFADDLNKRLMGDNGFSTEPDFFHDLFLTVAMALSTFNVSFDGSTIAISMKNADILIPGSYPALERNNLIGRHSLGATADALTDMFEYLRAQAPDTNVFLVAPQGRYLLLSNGEPTAGIRY